jgi:hypothetical protein
MASSNESPAATSATAGTFDKNDWIEFSDMNKGYYTFLLSTFSLATSFVSHPFTVVAVRQQAGSTITGDLASSQHGLLNNLKWTYKSMGLQGLFRGWVPIATMGMPSNVIYFNIVEITRERFQKALRHSFPSLPPMVIDGAQSVASAIVANFISLIPFVPAELISSRLIVQRKSDMGMTSVSRMIFQEKGYSGFFRGFSASFYVNCVAGTNWWFTYSTCKRLGTQTEVGKQHPFVVDSLSGLCAGLASILVSHPLDTVKTRIMTGGGDLSFLRNTKDVATASAALLSPSHPQQHSSAQLFSLSSQRASFAQVFRNIVSTDGYRGLYRGLSASMYQAAIGSTLFAASYEVIKSMASTRSDQNLGISFD